VVFTEGALNAFLARGEDKIAEPDTSAATAQTEDAK
jgi:hypothetical protein